jgi:hypothetical protein
MGSMFSALKRRLWGNDTLESKPILHEYPHPNMVTLEGESMSVLFTPTNTKLRFKNMA